MDIKTIIKIFLFILVISLIIYIRIYKIPILCLTCETEGTFTRCINGTGDKTTTCTVYKAQQKALAGITTAYSQLENTFETTIERTENIFEEAYEKIKTAKEELATILETILSLKIPKIPSINIPTIDNISCAIDLSNLPNFDICTTDITPSMNNNIITPINTAINKIETQINGLINDLKNAIMPINTTANTVKTNLNSVIFSINSTITTINNTLKLNISKIPNVNVAEIDTTLFDNNIIDIKNIQDLVLSCNLDISKLINDKIGITSLDVCSLLIKQINNTIVPKLNTAFGKIENSINTAIDAINNGIINSITIIQNNISNVILILENQLNSLNIFGGLITKIVNLITKIESLNIIGLIKIYVVPYISAIFPYATLADILTFLLLCLLIPFIIPLLLIINSIVNLIPDLNIPFSFSRGSNDAPDLDIPDLDS